MQLTARCETSSPKRAGGCQNRVRHAFCLDIPSSLHVCSGGGKISTFSRKSWKERWFVLRGGVLTYHDTVGGPVMGRIEVKEIVEIAISDALDKTVVDFSIVLPSKTIHLSCRNSEDCQVLDSCLSCPVPRPVTTSTPCTPDVFAHRIGWPRFASCAVTCPTCLGRHQTMPCSSRSPKHASACFCVWRVAHCTFATTFATTFTTTCAATHSSTRRASVVGSLGVGSLLAVSLDVKLVLRLLRERAPNMLDDDTRGVVPSMHAFLLWQTGQHGGTARETHARTWRGCPSTSWL